MAKIKGNLLMMNLSGMLGKQIVIKHRNGKPYACAAPYVDDNRRLTPNQNAWREKFKQFAAYASIAASHPETGKAYKAVAEPGQSAYTIAFKDACHAPKVIAVSVQAYKGLPGDKIFVQATDDFRVSAVKVSIYSPSGFLVEEGQAVTDGLLWMYEATVINESVAGSKIVASAFDLPGNEGTKEVLL